VLPSSARNSPRACGRISVTRTGLPELSTRCCDGGRTTYPASWLSRLIAGTTRVLIDRPRSPCHELSDELLGLIDVFPIGVAIATDPDCRTIHGNRAFRAMLALPPEQNLSMNAPADEPPPRYRCLRDGREIPAQELPMQVAASTGRTVTDEAFELVRDDGTTFQVIASAAPLHDHQGQDCGAIGVFHDHTQRLAAERALRFVADASCVLAESLDLQTTLDALLGLVVPRMADYAVINLRDEDDGRLRAAAVRHADPAQASTVAQLCGLCDADPEATAGTPWVVRSGQPQIVAGISTAFSQHVVQQPFQGSVEALRPHSTLIVPLKARGHVRGALTAVWTDRARSYDENDLPLFEELAARAAIAIDHASLYQRELQVASSFQQASLPRALPRMAGLEFDAVYLPGKRELEIGGDWYDAFALPDGRIALSVGDVVGSGLDAAIIMSQMRQALRAAAFIQPDPAAMLAAADLTLKAERPGAIATAIAAIFDPVRRTLTVASAGHPGPMLRRPDGSLFEVIATGLPLGLRERDELPPERITVPPGALLVFYTDGLTESRRDLAEGERRVRAALADATVVDALHPAAAIRDAVLYDGSRDDVAILTLGMADRMSTTGRSRQA
jgi:GAF domain-containing protein